MLWQFTLNGFVAAAIQIPLAIACAIVYCTGGFFDFSLGAALVGAAYFTFFLSHGCQCPLLLALAGGIFAGMVLQFFVRVAVYRPLESKRANRLLLMLASLGIYIAFQNGVSLIAGDSGRFLRPGAVEAGLGILGGRITQIQLITVLLSVFVAIVLEILQNHTRGGRILKAVANDSQLADILGIHSTLWVSAGHALAGGLAGLTGVFWALNVDFSPGIGMNAFMLATVAVIVGGAGSLGGVAGGAVLVALVSQIAVWKLGSQWQYAVTFLILLGFLLFCPKGISGKPSRKSNR